MVKNGKIYLKLNLLSEDVPIVILMKVCIFLSYGRPNHLPALTRFGCALCMCRPWEWNQIKRWCSSWAVNPTTLT
jgi:hypothetical protein